MSTAQDFIYTALRKCGQIRPGYLSQPELLADALTEWKNWFDALNATRTMDYTVPDWIYPVTAPGHGTISSGQGAAQELGMGYQIGPGSPDFNGPRPTSIARMNLYMTSVAPAAPTRLPIQMLNDEEWSLISVLNLTAINVTTTAYYDRQWPYGVIWLWPPLIGNSVEIFGYGNLVPPASLSAAYSAPPGWADLVTMTLAYRLYPLCTHDMMVNKVSHQWLGGQAILAREQVIRTNKQPKKLVCDFKANPNRSGSSDWTLLFTGIG